MGKQAQEAALMKEKERELLTLREKGRDLETQKQQLKEETEKQVRTIEEAAIRQKEALEAREDEIRNLQGEVARQKQEAEKANEDRQRLESHDVKIQVLERTSDVVKTDVNYIRMTVDEIKRDIKEARPR